MKLAFYIARRYLFSKKSHNAVNIISMISVCGIATATAALVIVLSTFNGLTDVASKSFNAFDPDLRVEAVQGKVFDPSEGILEKIKSFEEVELIAEVLEENALLKFEGRQKPIVMRGVSPEYHDLSDIESLLLDGTFALREGDTDFNVMGAGLATMMGIRAGFLSPIEIYVPKRTGRVNIANPASTFTRSETFISGVFALNQADYDDQMIIVSIDLARELLQYSNEVSSLSLKLKKGVNIDAFRDKLKASLGSDFLVKNRMEQQAHIYQWVNMEKWIVFFLLALIAMIAIFNVVGSLSMLIIEKSEDIKNLQSMGARNNLIAKIFMFEGWLITFIGGTVGLVIGVGICLIQQYFKILKIGEAGTFVVDAYPVNTQLFDIVVIFLTVNIIGFIAVLYPVQHMRKGLNIK